MKDGYSHYKLCIYTSTKLVVEYYDINCNVMDIVKHYLNGTKLLSENNRFYSHDSINFIDIEKTYKEDL